MHENVIVLNIPSDCAELFDKTARSYLDLEERGDDPGRCEEARALVAQLDRSGTAEPFELTPVFAWEVLDSCLDQATEEIRGDNEFEDEADLIKLEESITRVRYFAREYVALKTLRADTIPA